MVPFCFFREAEARCQLGQECSQHGGDHAINENGENGGRNQAAFGDGSIS